MVPPLPRLANLLKDPDVAEPTPEPRSGRTFRDGWCRFPWFHDSPNTADFHNCRISGLHRVEGIELGEVGLAFGSHPAERVDHFRIGQAMGDRVGNDLLQTVGAEVLVIVDVGLDFHALDQVVILILEDGGVAAMKSELYVGDVELDLLVTFGGAGMSPNAGVRLLGECAESVGLPDVGEDGLVHVAEHAVLLHHAVELLVPVRRGGVSRGPTHIPVVIQRVLAGKPLHVGHGGDQIEEAGDGQGVALAGIRVHGGGGGGIRVAGVDHFGDIGARLAQLVPCGAGEIKGVAVGKQLDIGGHGAAAGHGHGAPRSGLKSVRVYDEGVVVAEVIEEGYVEQLAAAFEVGESQSLTYIESPPVDGLCAPAHGFVEQLALAVVNVEDDVGVVWHMGNYYTPAMRVVTGYTRKRA